MYFQVFCFTSILKKKIDRYIRIFSFQRMAQNSWIVCTYYCPFSYIKLDYAVRRLVFRSWDFRGRTHAHTRAHSLARVWYGHKYHRDRSLEKINDLRKATPKCFSSSLVLACPPKSSDWSRISFPVVILNVFENDLRSPLGDDTPQRWWWLSVCLNGDLGEPPFPQALHIPGSCMYMCYHADTPRAIRANMHLTFEIGRNKSVWRELDKSIKQRQMHSWMHFDAARYFG